ncbi:hypothetical protein SLA2020_168770 [Shorea laevis]
MQKLLLCSQLVGSQESVSQPDMIAKGMPFGICFGGLKGTEPRLIEIAYGFDQVTKIRKPPLFMPGKPKANGKKSYCQGKTVANIMKNVIYASSHCWEH